MSLKQNINKIHSDLSDKFSSVKVLEKNNRKYNNYIELIVNENNKTMTAIIKKTDLENGNFDWVYKSNPLLEESYLVERNSNVDNFLNDVNDIFEKNRFDYDYLREVEKK